MTRAGALLLAVAAVAWARNLGQAGAAASVGTALAVGFTLLGAWVAGDLLRRLHLPRLTGYLLFGVLVGPYLGNVITSSMASQLQAITGLATTLIALIAGLTISLERLGGRLSAIVRLTTVTFAVVIIGIGTAAWFAWSWLPVAPESSGMTRAVIVCLLTIMVASVSPTMTAAVTTETGARGRLSELVLAVVVLADLVLLVLFSCAMQVARAVLRPDIEGPNLLVRFAWETGGAVAFGALVGALFALYLRYVGREVTLALLAMCGLLSQVGTTQQFEPLLAAVSAGLVIENLSVSQGDALRAAVQRGAPPVLIIFFVAIGSSLRVDALVALGPIALALAAIRTALIRIGVRAGVNATGIDPGVGRYAWTGLISQAGITVGLASVVASEFPGWGTQLQTLLIALIPIHELIGPMLFRRGLAQAGEQEARAPRPLLVVSNREPYLHVRRDDGSVTWTSATGGVAVALDALMRERGGTWIAHGAGSADRSVVDAADKILVPPEHPSYSLRRLWLEEPTFSAYYGGFANEGLWPLCHVVDVRPRFRAEEWAAYRDVNERFAAAIDEELDSSETPVFLQDYHLALVAPALRARRHAVRTALFWHIPWPHPDRLRICPWRTELVEGLAANDLLAFQLERDRRNFLQAAEEQLGAEVDLEASRIWVRGRPTTVISVPIGVDYDRIQDIGTADAIRAEQQRLHRELRLDAPLIGIGVDRLDYTKGIPERLAALDALVTRRPGAARAAHVRPDWRPLAIAPPRLRRDRGGDHGTDPGGQRTASRRRGAAARRVPHGAARDQEPRGALPPRRLLHRQLAARRDEPRREGVRRRARRRGRRARAERAGGRRAGAARSPHHQSVRRRRLCRRARARHRHAGRPAARADARASTRRRGPQRLRLGVGHPGRAREPVDATAALRGQGLGGHLDLA